ncbi:Kelch repeat-containing protein [Occallatibacter riparius]|uniref:Kelch motif-containing protein n=1 Tax=Occallatibacter riparius TaxID=1002689 RepID=A0A9J7BPX8_9BACT|nr:kelch repeat-containing protein [Occallatibacter riparius]UWZ84835.1 kelch motif-containing protein [Occallatibacter riparius]
MRQSLLNPLRVCGRLCCALVVCAVFAGAAMQVSAQANQWVWMGGGSTYNPVQGEFGTQGVPSAAHVPDIRAGAISWTDRSGSFWLFGGGNYSTLGLANTHNNDLWKYDPATNQWTWMSGSNTNAPGVYGVQGVAAADNAPGSRESGAAWTDVDGNLWLYGGRGFDAQGFIGTLDDLWKFDVARGVWTWMGGDSHLADNSKRACSQPSYGTLGVPSTANTPGGRMRGGAWTGADGTFWLFGGGGCDGILNDLWKYEPTSGMWTWMGGSATANDTGRYGTLGAASSSNVPAARLNVASWTDKQGRFWLFGGDGVGADGLRGYLNDLWAYDPGKHEWTWMSGSSSVGTENCYHPGLMCARSGVYGKLGQFAAGNVPGGREGSMGAVDASGDLLLFGGRNNPSEAINKMNDLWAFNIGTRQWAWISGSNVFECVTKDAGGACQLGGQRGVYGTLGAGAAITMPGSRDSGLSWSDKDGNFWIFGGEAVDKSGVNAPLNDLWVYQQLAPTFTLASDSNALTISAGGHGTVALTITPKNGFAAAVTFSCAGLPAGTTCSFAPSSVTPAGSAVKTQLTITSSASAAASAQAANHGHVVRPLLPLVALGLVGFFWLGGRRRGRLWLQAVLLLGLLASVTACGSGATAKSSGPTPPPQPPPTQPTVATVTITAASGSLNQATTLTLTVTH